MVNLRITVPTAISRPKNLTLILQAPFKYLQSSILYIQLGSHFLYMPRRNNQTVDSRRKHVHNANYNITLFQILRMTFETKIGVNKN